MKSYQLIPFAMSALTACLATAFYMAGKIGPAIVPTVGAVFCFALGVSGVLHRDPWPPFRRW